MHWGFFLTIKSKYELRPCLSGEGLPAAWPPRHSLLKGGDTVPAQDARITAYTLPNTAPTKLWDPDPERKARWLLPNLWDDSPFPSVSWYVWISLFHTADHKVPVHRAIQANRCRGCAGPSPSEPGAVSLKHAVGPETHLDSFVPSRALPVRVQHQGRRAGCKAALSAFICGTKTIVISIPFVTSVWKN